MPGQGDGISRAVNNRGKGLVIHTHSLPGSPSQMRHRMLGSQTRSSLRGDSLLPVHGGSTAPEVTAGGLGIRRQWLPFQGVGPGL